MSKSLTPWATLGSPPLLSTGAQPLLVYALLDGAQIHRLSSQLSVAQNRGNCRALFGEYLPHATADGTPHLLALQGPEAAGTLLRGWGDAILSHGAISVLVSALELDALAVRLSARLDARLPDQFDCVNRYFDGRVTTHLHAALRPEQREAFFSVSSQWWVIDHTFHWQSLPCHFSLLERFEPPLELDEAQQASLIDGCYPYAVIDHFLKTDEDLLDTVPAEERFGFFSQALQAASSFGIEGGATAVLFCTLALTRGPNFHQQADWQADLQRVKRGEIGLQQAVKAHHD